MSSSRKNTDTHRVSKAAPAPKAYNPFRRRKPKARTKLQTLTVRQRTLRRMEREKANPVRLDPREPRMKVEEAARYLTENGVVQVTHWTIRRWAHTGRIKYMRMGGRLLIPTAECDRILSNGLVLD